MNSRVLIDTNVLVYAYDTAEPEKQQRALAVLDELVATRLAALSTQVLSEFVVTVTRKIQYPLNMEQTYHRVHNLLQSWPVLDVTGLTVLEAIRGVTTHRFSYWDALIWATARLNQIPTVLSEDFNSGSTLEGITFVNPFGQ